MTSDKSKFNNYEVTSSSFIIIIDNNKCNIKDVENLKLPDLDIKIENIYHIHNLEFNLMSMNYLRHQGFKIVYDYKNDYFAVKTSKSKSTFKIKYSSNFIYQIQLIIAYTTIFNSSNQPDLLTDPEPDIDVYMITLINQKTKVRWDIMLNWHW